MRRAPRLLLTLVLATTAQGLAGAAAAKGGGGKGPAAIGEAQPEDLLMLAGLAALVAVVLGLALLLAYRSARPKPKKPSRKTFEAGRRLARAARPSTVAEAVAALERAPVGRLERVRHLDEGVEVDLARGRGQSCQQAAGYLAGLFESAWAREVRVLHPHCAGEKKGTCHYLVEPVGARRREGAPLSGSGARGGAASTRG